MIRNFTRTLLALSFYSMALTAVALCQTSGDELAEKVDKLFAAWNRPGTPGCAIAIIKDGKIITARGYGIANLEHNIPITKTTVFYIASTSKQFTAASIALLAQRNKLAPSSKDTFKLYGAVVLQLTRDSQNRISGVIPQNGGAKNIRFAKL